MAGSLLNGRGSFRHTDPGIKTTVGVSLLLSKEIKHRDQRPLVVMLSSSQWKSQD